VLDPSSFLACFDGASRYNGHADFPCAAGAGVVMATPAGKLVTTSLFLGDVSNNVAEFTAMVAACQVLSDERAGHAVIIGDSLLAVNALNGLCELHNSVLLDLMWTARCWLASIGSWVALHVPRANNSGADSAANIAVDSKCSSLSLRPPLAWAKPMRSPSMVRCAGHDDPACLPPALAAAPGIPSVLAGTSRPSASDVWFRNVDNFRAGNLHMYGEQWSRVSSHTSNGDRVRAWARGGVRASDFFRPFKGQFMGKWYNSASPPRAAFPNHKLPPMLVDFVSRKVAEGVVAGAIKIWGRVGVDEAPHLVLPVGVEPSKPRLFHDARFLNSWCVDVPFKFEGLQSVPDLAEFGDNAIAIDHSSGYWHVALTEDSYGFFGFEWEGVYYTYVVLSFGWKISPMIYNSFSGELAGFTRRLGMRNLYLLDDFLGFPLRRRGLSPPLKPLEAANSAAYVLLCLMVGLGYYIHPKKSILSPTRNLVWLGLTVDFDHRRFLVPEKKRLSIQALTADVLSQDSVLFKTLERLVGKCGSLYLAVPGAHLMLRQCYAAMADSHGAMSSSSPACKVIISAALRLELELWLDIEGWCGGFATWPRAHHFTLVVDSPPAFGTIVAKYASPSRSGVVPFRLDSRAAPSWQDALGDAVMSALESCPSIGGPQECYVDIVLHGEWRPYTLLARDLAVAPGGARRAMRLLRWMAANSVVSISVIRIPDPTPSAWFAVDRGSFVLRISLWKRVERLYGPHDIDSMSSDANAQRSTVSGDTLPHFTRWPSANSAGVNVFSQPLAGLNIYCNAVFGLILPLLSCFEAQRARVSMIVPGWYGSIPAAPWWPKLVASATSRVLLAPAGTPGVFSNLQSDGSWAPSGPVPWDIWVFRLDFSIDRSGAGPRRAAGL
jgi:ribonuclease HI